MSTLTAEQIKTIDEYWSLPPVVRDERYGKWPLRSARDDITALLGHIKAMQALNARLRDEQKEWP